MAHNMHFALAPNGLPANAGPAGGAQPGQEFAEIALILGLTGKAAEGVNLARSGGTPGGAIPGQLAAGHCNRSGAFAGSAEVELERPRAEQLSKRRDTVLQAREQD